MLIEFRKKFGQGGRDPPGGGQRPPKPVSKLVGKSARTSTSKKRLFGLPLSA